MFHSYVSHYQRVFDDNSVGFPIHPEDELGLERAMCQAVKDGASGWVTVSSRVPEPSPGNG